MAVTFSVVIVKGHVASPEAKLRSHYPYTMSDDFLAREAAILGTNFSSSGTGLGGGDIDFDRAVSAFPELDFDGDVPLAPVSAIGLEGSGGGLNDGFGAFEESLPSLNGHSKHSVKITGGDDVVDRFESEFPAINSVWTRLLWCGPVPA